MTLPWVRLDSNIASHDKVLSLLEERPPALAYQAAFSYVCSLGYCGSHGTDGMVPFGALAFIHGTRKTAELLVRNYLWTPVPEGWRIPKWDTRQQSQAVSESIRRSRRAAASKGNCMRWHGKDCKCWEEAS